MPTWTVEKYVASNGNCPIDKWKKGLTPKDRARLDAKVESIERTADLPPNTVEKYTGTELYELKVLGDKKQLRPFGVMQPGKRFVLLSGAIEKGGLIPPADRKRAERLRKDLEKSVGRVKGYAED